MLQPDQRWELTRHLIRNAWRTLLRKGARVDVEVIFGRPHCHATRLANGKVALNHAVPAHWLETVHAEGLACVDSALLRAHADREQALERCLQAHLQHLGVLPSAEECLQQGLMPDGTPRRAFLIKDKI